MDRGKAQIARRTTAASLFLQVFQERPHYGCREIVNRQTINALVLQVADVWQQEDLMHSSQLCAVAVSSELSVIGKSTSCIDLTST